MTTKLGEKKALPFRYQFGAGAVAGISEVRITGACCTFVIVDVLS
jgi:hypothetical protein